MQWVSRDVVACASEWSEFWKTAAQLVLKTRTSVFPKLRQASSFRATGR